MRDTVLASTLLTIIGNGANKLSEIASRAGKEANSLSEPLGKSQIHTDSWLGFKVTQISQMTQIFLDLFGQMTQIFPTAVTPKGYFRTKGDDVICRLCLAKLLYCGEVFDMHTLPEGIQ